MASGRRCRRSRKEHGVMLLNRDDRIPPRIGFFDTIGPWGKLLLGLQRVTIRPSSKGSMQITLPTVRTRLLRITLPQERHGSCLAPDVPHPPHPTTYACTRVQPTAHRSPICLLIEDSWETLTRDLVTTLFRTNTHPWKPQIFS